MAKRLAVLVSYSYSYSFMHCGGYDDAAREYAITTPRCLSRINRFGSAGAAREASDPNARPVTRDS